jgi:hypothetical protein
MIDLYNNSREFIFHRGIARVGTMPFATLELAADPKATDDEIFYMKVIAKDYLPGEVFKNGSLTVVLGPVRDFTHEVTLRAYGNPDHGQYADIAPKKTVKVVGLEEASAITRRYITHNEMGAGNCGPETGVVWELPKDGKGKRRKIGRVSPNGSFRTVAEIKASDAKFAASLTRPK